MRSTIQRLLCLCLLNALIMSGAYASGGGKSGEKSAEASEYMEIKPALITNYGGPGPLHFIKAEITLRLSKTAEAREIATHHMPRIRHELILLLNRQSEENLASMQGKEQLRRDALATVQKLMAAETGKKNIEDVLFTNFVIQR